MGAVLNRLNVLRGNTMKKSLAILLLLLLVVGCGKSEPTSESSTPDHGKSKQAREPNKSSTDSEDTLPDGEKAKTAIAALEEIDGELDKDDDGNFVEIYLNGSLISDTDCLHLKVLKESGFLKHLHTLTIYSSKITDSSLVHLEQLTSLQVLDLSRNKKITDAGVALLSELPNLTELRIDGSQITDAAIADLKKLTKLRSLSISNTKISSDGVAQLEKALPQCIVFP